LKENARYLLTAHYRIPVPVNLLIAPRISFGDCIESARNREWHNAF